MLLEVPQVTLAVLPWIAVHMEMSVGIIHRQVVPVVSFVADPMGAVVALVMLTINV